jgi:hypothetical protein
VKFSAAVAEALKTYNTQRGELAEKVSTHELSTGKALFAHERLLPCPAGAVELGGTDKPMALGSAEALEKF